MNNDFDSRTTSPGGFLAGLLCGAAVGAALGVVFAPRAGAETRQQYGVVPGAVLLTNHKDYALSELPPEKSKPLVFYCGGTACRASDKAADRAAGAGYTNVNVMREGIKGWASAGQKTVPQT